jgi:cytochrome b
MTKPDEPTARRNWDPVVKLTHWGIVFAVIANALFTGEGSNAHVWVGFALASLLALRLIWGVIGPAEARFSAFPPSPKRAIAHIREISTGKGANHTSHNPLRALMVYAIWGALGVVIASGIAMAGIPATDGEREGAKDIAAVEKTAPAERSSLKSNAGMPADYDQPAEGENLRLAAYPVPAGQANGKHRQVTDLRSAVRDGSPVSEEAGEPDRQIGTEVGEKSEHAEGDHEEEGAITELHEVAVNLLYLLIALHLAGVLFETYRKGREIPLAMMPGRR